MASATLSNRILKAMGLFGGVQVAVIALSVLRNKFVAIWLGPAGVALNAIFISTQDLITSAAGMSLRTGGVREMSASSPSELPRVAGTLLRVSLGLATLGAVLTVAFSPLLSELSMGSTAHWWWFALLAAGVGAAIVCDADLAMLQACGRLKSLASVTLASALLVTAVSIPLYYVLNLNAVLPVYLLMTVSYAVWARRTRRRCCPRPVRTGLRGAFRQAGPLLRLGMYLTLAGVAERLGSYIFVVYMNREASAGDLGIYQAGFTMVGSYVGIIFTAISTEYYPRLASVASSALRTQAYVGQEFKLAAWVLTPVILVFLAADELIVRVLYSSGFLAMLPFIGVAICGVTLRAFSVCVAYVILARGDGRTFVFTESLGVLAGLLLKIAGYRLWGFAGLGAAYVAEQALYSALVWAVYRRRYGLRSPRGAAALLAGSTAVAFLALWGRLALGWWLPLVMLPPVAVAAWRHVALNKRSVKSVKTEKQIPS